MNLILKSHKCGGGFFSQFNLVIQGLDFYNSSINRVIWNMEDAPAFQYNSGDVYKLLFEEYNDGITSNETITVDTFIDQNYTAHLAVNKYLEPTQKEWRLRFNRIYKKYIKHTNYLENIYNNTFKQQFDQYKDTPKIGILIRNNNLCVEQPRKVSPSIDLYLKAINELNLNNFTLVCGVDNKQDLEFLKTEYKTIYNPNTTRSETARHSEPHHNSRLQAIDAAYHYLEGYALSQCDYFIHPVSNVATAALIMNPELKNILVIG